MLSTRSVTPFLHSFLLLFDRAERENGMGRQGILCSLVTSCQKVDRFVWVLLRSIQRAPFEEFGLLWIGIFPLNGYRREKPVDFGSSPEKISEANHLDLPPFFDSILNLYIIWSVNRRGGLLPFDRFIKPSRRAIQKSRTNASKK